MRFVVAATCALLVSVAANSSQAQGSMRRFQHYVQEATEAYQAGNADAAIAALEHAYEIREVPIILFNIGRAHELGGRLDRAIEYYDRFLATHPDPDSEQQARDARANAQRALDERRRASASVAPAPVARPGPTPHPRAPGRPIRVHHILLVGGGAVLAIGGGIFGALALINQTNFQGTYDPTLRAAYQDRGQRDAILADIGIPVGVAALALGTVLYLIQPVPRPPTDSASTAP